jgi:arylsulfatase A-like enzyme
VEIEMSDRPNILVIQGDQHRWDCLGAYGNVDVKTPHIDGLAGDGVRYDNSYCPFPSCTPSRYSFLTSLYPHQHCGLTNHSTIPQGLATFPKILRSAGYRTKAVGKMHFTPTYADLGFSEMVLAEQNGAGRYDDDYHRWLRDEGLENFVDLMDQEREYRKDAPQEYWDRVGAMVSDLDEAHHSTTWIGDRAVEELETWEGGGNLLMTSFIKPHHPLDPPAPWDEMYDPESLTLLPGYTPEPLARDLAHSPGYFPNAEMTEEKIRGAMGMYYGTISQIDHHVGRMVAALKARGLYDNTLILYNSDHGDYMGYHHLLLKGNYMYESVIRVPLIIKYPGQTNGGTASDALVNSIDAAPTLLNVTGCEVPSEMVGADLRSGVQDREVIFAEVGRDYMVRSRRHKLLLCQNDDRSLFFDLEADPFEIENRYTDPDYAEAISELKEALAKWMLFDTKAPVHLDEDAPIISTPNAQRQNDGHRKEIYGYFQDRMQAGLR